MITKEKLKIFMKYDGNIDDWARRSTKNEKAVMSDNDWRVIESLVQDIFLAKKGLASEEFSKNLNDKLNDSCDNQETINALWNVQISI